MARKPRPPVEREGSHFRINIGRDERELIRRLMAEMRTLLTESDDGDGRLQRIFPAAYHQPGDGAFNVEYQRLMRDEILTSRLKGLDAVDTFLQNAAGDRAVLSEAQMMAFLQALNGVRLVLGTMLDITEDHDIGGVDENDPLVNEYNLYDFLSWILDWSVRAVQL
jgi:Domain of unknown function (DUF2017)